MIRYFNSQPHKEADADELGFEENTVISTHSLTRRLTIVIVDMFGFTGISTHSLTRRLTMAYTDYGFYTNISTHSLTRRLTGAKGCEESGN